MTVVIATISMPSTMIRQFAAAELKTSDAVGCFFMARNSGVSSSERRSTKMNGTIRQPMKNGMRQPHAAMVSAVHRLAQRKADEAATRIATCWLADWNEV